MKKDACRTIVPFFFVLCCMIQSCEKEPPRLGNYRVEFATAIVENRQTRFQLDNRKILLPSDRKNFGIKNNQRILLNYTALQNNTIIVNRVNPVFTDAIRLLSPEIWHRVPVKIQSIWVGGDYLNMILEVEYHSKPHKFGVFSHETNKRTLYFSHDSNGDLPGYPKMMYLSFLLKNIDVPDSSSSVPFSLSIETYSGLRTLYYTYR